jgi:hypothetical protein
MLNETSLHLSEISFKKEESVIRYYSKQVEDINSRIFDYEQKISQSPDFFKRIHKEKEKITTLKN